MKVKTLFNILLVIAALGLAFLATRSILRPEKYKAAYNQRAEEIRVRLVTIRAVQAVYRNEFKEYAGDIDILVDFANNGVVHIIKMSGDIPDEMTEEAAYKAGLIKKTTEVIPARDKIIEADPNVNAESLKNFEFVPYGDGKKFEIQLGIISSRTYEIPVYRIDVPLEDILINLDRTIIPKEAGVTSRLWNKMFYSGLAEETQYKDKYRPMWLGSLKDAGTSGSWE
jgi:predicted nucleotidyltransferase